METTIYGLEPVPSKKVQALFKQPQITKRDADALSPEESKELFDIITRLFNELTGEEKDDFEFKIEPLLQPETKRQVWEQNHLKIVLAIQQNIQKYGTMPTRTQLAEETGISRKSIQHHIKEYEKNANYLAQKEQYKFMGNQLLTAMLRKGLGGDVGAAKLVFNIITPKTETPATGSRTLVQNQNNYIQINNTVLNQEKLNQLTPAQLTAIEGIINGQLQKPALQQPEPVEE